MKRHPMASAVDVGKHTVGSVAGALAARTHTATEKNARTSPLPEANTQARLASEKSTQTGSVSETETRTYPTPVPPSLALAGVSVWKHTLILTGELNHRTAHALEAEIERLCDEGVTGITLDLRELTNIDSIGVAVIAFRSGLCIRRGYDFALIPGSRFIQGEFEQAGLSDVLPFRESDLAAAIAAGSQTLDGHAGLRAPSVLMARSRNGCEQ